MGRIVSGREYNYAIVYESKGQTKVLSYATTSPEADLKLLTAQRFLDEPERSTLRIEALEE